MEEQQSTPIKASSEAETSVQAEARRWLMAIYAEGGSVDEGRFRAWLEANPEHARAYRALEQAWRDLPLSNALDIDISQAPSQRLFPIPFIRARREASSGRRALSGAHRWLAAVAASLLVCVALGLSLWAGRNGGDNGAAVTAAYSTGVAQIATVRLPDGSTVALGANSRIAATFNRMARAIKLERGTAYFDIAHDASRPASVEAANVNLRVLGTAFEVWRGPSGVRLSVVRGRVAVDVDRPQPGVAKPDAHAASLGSGEQITIKADGTLTWVSAFTPGDLLSWRSGRLVYRDAALADIVADLNRYRLDPILIIDQRAASLRVTAAFNASQADQVLSGLAASLPIVVRKSGKGLVISASN